MKRGRERGFGQGLVGRRVHVEGESGLWRVSAVVRGARELEIEKEVNGRRVRRAVYRFEVKFVRGNFAVKPRRGDVVVCGRGHENCAADAVWCDI
jgi:hypothetical protein